MFVFLLILLLLAAAVGVLGVVLKVTLVLVLSVIFSLVLLAWIGVWYAKRKVRGFQREVEARMDHLRRRDQAHDAGSKPGLGDGR